MHDQLQLSAAKLARWQCPVASTKALDLLHRAMHTVLYRCTAAAIKMTSKVGPFLWSFHLLLPWQPLGQYGASSRPMAASSGFQGSPGHAALGNTVYIAPAHRRGHQNVQQMRYICSLLPTFSLTLFVAKGYVMAK
jgi:hypothetical protein